MSWNRRWAGEFAVAVACAITTACSGGNGSATRDAGADAPHDGGTDANADACVSGPPSVTLCCTETITEACKNGGCWMTWPADPLAFCSFVGLYQFSIRDCGRYHVFRDDDIDVGSSLYFDIQSGKLVAIDNVTDCYGPGTFTRPDCTTPWTSLTCPDADSGVGDGAANTGGADGATDAGNADAGSD